MFGGRFRIRFRLRRRFGLGDWGGFGFGFGRGRSFHDWFGDWLGSCLGLRLGFGLRLGSGRSWRSLDFGWLILDGRCGGAGAGTEGAKVDDFDRLDFLGFLARGKRNSQQDDEAEMNAGHDQDGAPQGARRAVHRGRSGKLARSRRAPAERTASRARKMVS